ncbi:12040_t:CDS:2 [Cetraspora pellucida]|uniref:12040_t:CDS:1 n=1 Tax=Cetraspora pellucida TaxID=1433469 RepID=A0ACA9KP47_9GLOM|nr:12040_t:CDS:2 [Cetraspora pellucida]
MTIASHQYAKVNNPQCFGYDPSKPTSWTMYEDMNALYSGTMMQYMPTEIIGKVGSKKVSDIQTIVPNAEIGYMSEVDLEVLAHLQDFFTNYPLVPKKQIISKNWLSLYNEILVYNKNIKEKKYVSGEKLEYIEKNIRKHKIVKANGDEFGVIYYKLKNNAVFGKQMKNVYTDSLIMQIETEDIYKDRAERPDIFDLNYLDDLFLMKNETKGILIEETVCLKPKMYSVLSAEHDPKTLNNPNSEDPKKKHSIQKAKRSDQIQYSNINLTIWTHFKKVFDQERNAKNLIFDEMCNRIEGSGNSSLETTATLKFFT